MLSWRHLRRSDSRPLILDFLALLLPFILIEKFSDVINYGPQVSLLINLGFFWQDPECRFFMPGSVVQNPELGLALHNGKV